MIYKYCAQKGQKLRKHELEEKNQKVKHQEKRRRDCLKKAVVRSKQVTKKSLNKTKKILTKMQFKILSEKRTRKGIATVVQGSEPFGLEDLVPHLIEGAKDPEYEWNTEHIQSGFLYLSYKKYPDEAAKLVIQKTMIPKVNKIFVTYGNLSSEKVKKHVNVLYSTYLDSEISELMDKI